MARMWNFDPFRRKSRPSTQNSRKPKRCGGQESSSCPWPSSVSLRVYMLPGVFTSHSFSGFHGEEHAMRPWDASRARKAGPSKECTHLSPSKTSPRSWYVLPSASDNRPASTLNSILRMEVSILTSVIRAPSGALSKKASPQSPRRTTVAFDVAETLKCELETISSESGIATTNRESSCFSPGLQLGVSAMDPPGNATFPQNAPSR